MSSITKTIIWLFYRLNLQEHRNNKYKKNRNSRCSGVHTYIEILGYD